MLEDGQHFVVEYKGLDRWSNAEETEKRELGELWEARSGGKCLFESYSSGSYSDQQIANLLNENGYRTKGKGKRRSRPWTKDTVRRLLTNPFFCGLAKYHSTKGTKDNHLFPGKHPVIVDDTTWKSCQEVRARLAHKRRANRKTLRVYPLSGIAVCTECGLPLRGQATARNVRYYSGPARQHGRSCDQKKMVKAAIPEKPGRRAIPAVAAPGGLA